MDKIAPLLAYTVRTTSGRCLVTASYAILRSCTARLGPSNADERDQCHVRLRQGETDDPIEVPFHYVQPS